MGHSDEKQEFRKKHGVWEKGILSQKALTKACVYEEAGLGGIHVIYDPQFDLILSISCCKKWFGARMFQIRRVRMQSNCDY